MRFPEIKSPECKLWSSMPPVTRRRHCTFASSIIRTRNLMKNSSKTDINWKKQLSGLIWTHYHSFRRPWHGAFCCVVLCSTHAHSTLTQPPRLKSSLVSKDWTEQYTSKGANFYVIQFHMGNHFSVFCEKSTMRLSHFPSFRKTLPADWLLGTRHY